jgi:hypothetical protein
MRTLPSRSVMAFRMASNARYSHGCHALMLLATLSSTVFTKVTITSPLISSRVSRSSKRYSWISELMASTMASGLHTLAASMLMGTAAARHQHQQQQQQQQHKEHAD